MSDFLQTRADLSDPDAIEARFQRNKALVKKSQKLETGEASALVLAAYAYGDAMDENRLFRMASHAAKLFCIAAVFIIPNLLVIRVLF